MHVALWKVTFDVGLVASFWSLSAWELQFSWMTESKVSRSCSCGVMLSVKEVRTGWAIQIISIALYKGSFHTKSYSVYIIIIVKPLCSVKVL